MKIVHPLLWCLFTVLIVSAVIQNGYVKNKGKSLQIIKLETANNVQGKSLLDYYNSAKINGTPLIHYIKVSIVIDFAFIVSYVGVVIMLSYSLMQNEKNILLNDLLRLNILLSIIVGLLDIAENIILLIDINNYSSGKNFISAAYVSYPKWLMLIYIVMISLISIFRRMFSHGELKT